MKNLRNKNHPPNADLVQVHFESSYDVVKAVYDALYLLEAIGIALVNGSLQDFLVDADINTLAKLNAVVTDATLGDVSSFATAAQGFLAENSIQGPFATQAEAEGGIDNDHAMTPLRVAQAVAILAAGLKNNFDSIVDPTALDDSSLGYSAGSAWINITPTPPEAYRCADPTVGSAVWIKTTLTSDELALVALSGNSDDLIQGTVKLLMTVAERAKLAAIESGATGDLTGAEIKSLYEGELDTNAFDDAAQAKLGGIEAGATADQSDLEIETAYNNQVPLVNQVTAEGGTSNTVHRWTPERVAQAIGALANKGLTSKYYTLLDNNVVLTSGTMNYIDALSGAFTVKLPPNPVDGTIIMVADYSGAGVGQNSVIDRNGKLINLNASNEQLIFAGQYKVYGYDAANGSWRRWGNEQTPDIAEFLTEAEVDLRVITVAGNKYIGQNLQTGAAYQLVLADAGKIVEMDDATPNILTIPSNASVPFPVNTRIDVIQYGTGQTTIAITSDTLRGDAKIGGQYKCVCLWKRAITEWVVVGGAA